MRVVEVGRNRDHSADQITAQGGLGALLQVFQDFCGYLHRAAVTRRGADARHTGGHGGELVRQGIAEGLDILKTSPHEALNRRDGVQRILSGSLKGLVTHVYIGGRQVAHHGGQHVTALCVRQGIRQSATHRGNQGVGRSKINAHRETMLVRGGGKTGFADL